MSSEPNYYDRVVDFLTEFKSLVLMLVVDVETTGLDVDQDDILQIAVSGITRRLNVLWIYNSFFYYPTVRPDCWVFSHSDLKYEEIAKCGPISAEDIRLLNFLFAEVPYVAGYNVEFDRQFLAKYGIALPNIFSPDPMELLTPILKLPYNGREFKYKWPNFSEAYRYLFNREPSGQHNANCDAENEAKLIIECIENGFYSDPLLYERILCPNCGDPCCNVVLDGYPPMCAGCNEVTIAYVEEILSDNNVSIQVLREGEECNSNSN